LESSDSVEELNDEIPGYSAYKPKQTYESDGEMHVEDDF
jgi:hypothetical protein